MGEMQIPLTKVMPRQKDMSQKLGFSNSGGGKIFKKFMFTCACAITLLWNMYILLEGITCILCFWGKSFIFFNLLPSISSWILCSLYKVYKWYFCLCYYPFHWTQAFCAKPCKHMEPVLQGMFGSNVEDSDIDRKTICKLRQLSVVQLS